jgi:hypothetical protein
MVLSEVLIRFRFKSHFRVWLRFGASFGDSFRAWLRVEIEERCRLKFEVLFRFMCGILPRDRFRVWCNIMFKVGFNSRVEFGV